MQSGHFFGLELYSGHLYLHLNLGTGHVKIRVSQVRIDDGAWHNFHTERTNQFGKVTLDGQASDFIVPGRLEIVFWGSLMISNQTSHMISFALSIFYRNGMWQSGPERPREAH